MSLASELDHLADALRDDANSARQISLPSVAERIAKSLGVRTEEVAIMGLSSKWRHLYFLVPEALKSVGYVPLSSKSAISARTVRESRPEIINDFAAVKHASVFEGVKVAGEIAEAIQKIISAPILCDGIVVGVIQISRKGASPMAAGADFTPNDLGKVLALCKPLGKLIQHLTAE
jgi:hypothetical protein